MLAYMILVFLRTICEKMNAVYNIFCAHNQLIFTDIFFFCSNHILEINFSEPITGVVSFLAYNPELSILAILTRLEERFYWL